MTPAHLSDASSIPASLRFEEKSFFGPTNMTGLPLGFRNFAGTGGSEVSKLKTFRSFTELSF